MTDSRDVPRSIVILFAGRFTTAAATLVATYVLMRSLDASEFGLYALFVSLFTIAGSFVDFGGNAIASRDLARHPDRARTVLGVLLAARSVFAVVMTLGIALYVVVSVSSERATLLLACLAIPVLVFNGFEAWFLTIGRLGRVVAPRAVTSLLFVIALAGLEAEGRLGFSTAVFLRVAFAAVAALWIAAFAWRYVPPDFSKVRSDLAPFLRGSGVVGIATACTMLYFYLDTFLLERIHGTEEVAVYQAAYRLFGFAVTVIAMVLYPFFPYLARVDAKERGVLAGRLLFFVSLLVAPAACAAIVLAPDIARDYFGGGVYERSVPALRILMVTLMTIGGGMIGSTALVAAGLERAWLGIAAFGLLANGVANLIVLPSYGAPGAAVTTLATEAAVATMTLVVLGRRSRIRVPLRNVVIVLLVSAVATAGAWMLAGRPLVVSALVLVPAGLLLAGLGLREMRGGTERGESV